MSPSSMALCKPQRTPSHLIGSDILPLKGRLRLPTGDFCILILRISLNPLSQQSLRSNSVMHRPSWAFKISQTSTNCRPLPISPLLLLNSTPKLRKQWKRSFYIRFYRLSTVIDMLSPEIAPFKNGNGYQKISVRRREWRETMALGRREWRDCADRHHNGNWWIALVSPLSSLTTAVYQRQLNHKALNIH